MKLAVAGLWIVASAALWASNAKADIKVGIVVSASGPGSALGQPQIRTVAALPKEIGGEKVTYVVLDDESDPTKGAQNARRLVIQDELATLQAPSGRLVLRVDQPAVAATLLGSRLEPAELAAWTQVCRVVLNLHETITRY